MNFIVTQEGCPVCKELKEKLPENNDVKYIDINSKEGLNLVKKFDIKYVPFAVNENMDKSCKIKVKEDKIKVDCNVKRN